MNTKDFTNEQGECPKCHGKDLNYGTAEFEDNVVYFPWVCPECKIEGSEWYRMEFIGHNIITEDGEEIEL
jgi:hypothetical protein